MSRCLRLQPGAGSYARIMFPPVLDTQLDLLALMQAHRDRDREAAAVILANCDAPAVANLAARLLAGVMSAADVDELRAAVLRA